ncbi:MAG: ABC transporter permease [Oscillospiraceae bacterium]|nr:ABC transporter permease [Oscillospiraceae bacterium]
MKKRFNFGLLISHLMLIAFICIVEFAPKKRGPYDPTALLIATAIAELLFLWSVFKKIRKKQSLKGCADIIIIVWGFMIAWEIACSVMGALNPVVFPTPENTFEIFIKYRKSLVKHVLYSLELLGISLTIGVVSAVILGVICAWVPRLRSFTYPIANVMAPIPPVVFSPYLIIIMSSFRAASIMIVVLGVFWSTFMNTFQNVQGIDKRTIDSAKMLNLNNWEMIFTILLPSVMPPVLNRLKITLTTSLLMLNFAEMMGANAGIGFFICNATAFANYEQAIAGIILSGIVVTVLNKLTSFVQKHALKWK